MLEWGGGADGQLWGLQCDLLDQDSLASHQINVGGRGDVTWLGWWG